MRIINHTRSLSHSLDLNDLGKFVSPDPPKQIPILQVAMKAPKPHQLLAKGSKITQMIIPTLLRIIVRLLILFGPTLPLCPFIEQESMII